MMRRTGMIAVAAAILGGTHIGVPLQLVGTAHAREWTSAVWASGAARAPRQDVRVVAGGDTVSNPFDYELVFGAEDTDGPLRGRMVVSWEREEGRHFLGRVLELRATGRWAEVGWGITDLPDDGLFTNRFWAEKKLLNGVAGVGVTRIYFGRGFGRGMWLLRSSVAHEAVDVGGVTMAIAGVFERSSRAQRVCARLELRNLAWGDGRYGITPMGELERTDDGRAVRMGYRAKVVARMGV